MTLVVGYADHQKAFLVGDTYFTSPLARVRTGDAELLATHGLKIHIMSPRVAVAFSGDVQTAIELIASLGDELGALRTSIAQWLHSRYLAVLASARDPGAIRCEFLVLQLREEGNLLERVEIGGITSGERAYIGDPVEYSRLRALAELPRHQLPKRISSLLPDGESRIEDVNDPPGSIEAYKISSALQEIVQRIDHGSVGAIAGLITRVSNAWPFEDRLQYLEYGEIGDSPWEDCIGVHVLASSAEVRGVGIYFRGWGRGLIMLAADRISCRQEEADTVQKFVDVARRKYGLQLTGPT